MSFPRIALSATALVLCAGLLAACGRDQSTVVVKDDGETVYHTAEDGAEVRVAREGESLEVGDALPSFAPAYPGATVKTQLADVNREGARGGMWVLETADPVEKVAAFYDAKAKEAGVKPGMFVNDKDSAVRIFGGQDGKADKAEGALIAISREDGEQMTKIVITAGAAVSAHPRSSDVSEAGSSIPASPQRLQ